MQYIPRAFLEIPGISYNVSFLERPLVVTLLYFSFQIYSLVEMKIILKDVFFIRGLKMEEINPCPVYNNSNFLF